MLARAAQYLSRLTCPDQVAHVHDCIVHWKHKNHNMRVEVFRHHLLRRPDTEPMRILLAVKVEDAA